MNSKIKGTVKKLEEFSEKKREQAIVNITNSTATVMFFKWILTNRVAVVLSVVMAFGYWYYRNENEYLRDLADKARIVELQEELAEEIAQTEELLREIEEFNADRSSSIDISNKVKRRVGSLSLEEKRKTLLRYRDRLVEKRGLK